MIEILGYIFLYLIVGVVLLPFLMLADKLDAPEGGNETTKGLLFGAMCFWPISISIAIPVLWRIGWGELKNYK